MGKSLIIEIIHTGLGDHLFHSHLPKIAKESGYEKVYISKFSPVVHPDYRNLVWECNPYVDGFVDKPGTKVDIGELVVKIHKNSKTNLLDEVMLAFGLDNNKRWNKPEVYYKPKYVQEYNKVVYDPNFLSWIGLCTKEDAMTFFKKNNVNFDAIMKLRGGKHFYIPTGSEQFIETPTLEDFCDLIFSCKELHCLTSGTATLAEALNKSATVYYGEGQPVGYQHSKNHTYKFVKRYFMNRVKRKLNL
ncbi:hypothetical protein [Brumimicrobium sp.]|uniref:hypothetical protein n=1 Tax=Brumimicrobium sp. TaxID=2029867 RepID=UPI003A95D15B